MDSGSDILDYFRILKKRGSLGSSYLFIGQDRSIVFDIVKLISCRNDVSFCDACWDCRKIKERAHPDLLIVEPEYLTTTIGSIRQAIGFLSLKSFCLPRKVLLIADGLTFNQESASAFLKTLEEPPDNSFIAVCASKIEGLLPTIVSRCRKIFLPSRPETFDDSLFSLAADFLRGEEVGFSDRKQFASFLRTLIVLLRASLVSKFSPGNNQLPASKEYEIIVGRKDAGQLSDILKRVLMVYSAHSSVNMNLGLNVIRLAIDAR
jgi:hypothetical protein